MSNQEPVCCSCPGPVRAHPAPGGTARVTSPSNPGSCCVPTPGPHPRCASTPAPPLPRARIASPAWKTQLELLRSGHSTEFSRLSHGGLWEGLDYWSSGSGVASRASLCCFPAAPCIFPLSHACPSPPAPASSETLPRAGTSQAEPTAHSPSVQEDGALSRDPSTDQLLHTRPEPQHGLSPHQDRRNWNLQRPAAHTAWIYPCQSHEKATYQPGIQTMVLRHFKFK